MNTEQLRAEFEAWLRERKPDMSLKRYADGRYMVTTVDYAFEAYQAGRAALQSQATEAFPCRIVEADFETATVTLEMYGKYTVSSGQKYLCDAPLQSQDREDAPFLQEEDQHALYRFIETAEDGEGYDIGKDRIKRLADLGVVSNQGFGRYSVTMFGYWCHERYWHQNPSLPLKTIDEHNAQAAIDHARRIEGEGE